MELFNTPIFGIVLSIIAYSLGVYLFKRFKSPFLNPMLFALIAIILILKIFGIPYDYYEKGASMITFFLGPATVLLAVPLYKQRGLLIRYFFPIIIGIISGSAAGAIIIFLAGKVFKLDRLIVSSLMPKSTTAPIALELSNILGGNTSLTIAFVALTGIMGYIIGERILKVFKISHPIAKGIALGTASHAIGTAKAMEIGEVEGAMSSLSIGAAGIATVLLIPFINFLIKLL